MRASGLRLGKAAVLQDGRHESGFCATANSNLREMEGQAGYRYLSGHRHGRCLGQMEE